MKRLFFFFFLVTIINGPAADALFLMLKPFIISRRRRVCGLAGGQISSPTCFQRWIILIFCCNGSCCREDYDCFVKGVTLEKAASLFLGCRGKKNLPTLLENSCCMLQEVNDSSFFFRFQNPNC